MNRGDLCIIEEAFPGVYIMEFSTEMLRTAAVTYQGQPGVKYCDKLLA